jgi:site-specific recombinase XerD
MKPICTLNSSELRPRAQIAALCFRNSFADSGVFETALPVLKCSDLSIQDKSMIELLSISGARISEILNINAADIQNDGKIFLKGLKHSENRLIQPVIFKEFFIKCKLNNLKPYYGLSRFYYYRIFKKKGLIAFHSQNKKNSVCHSFRHNFISNLANAGIDIEDIKKFVGHKSLKSTLHYVNKNKK